MQLNSSEPSLESPIPANPAPVYSCFWPGFTRFAYFLSRYFVPFYFSKIEVTGQEHIPQHGSAIFAPTHRSRWDSIILPYIAECYATGRYLRFMVTADEMKGFQGWLIAHLGGFSIDVRQPSISSLRYAVELLVEGGIVVIFPEGNIFQDGLLHPLKPGLARLAIQTESMQPDLGLKILPIRIHYGRLVPTWRCGVKIKIGSPLSVADYCVAYNKKSAPNLTADLKAALEEIDANG